MHFEVPLLQAHRGSWGEGFTENSLSAFQNAKNLGFKMIECDIRLTKDKVPIIFHDHDLKRTAGVRKRIRALTAKKISEYVPLFTLKDLLTRTDIPEYLNIEIKNESLRYDLIEKAVAKVINECDSTRRILISSFNPVSLMKMKKLCPGIGIGLLVTQEKTPLNNFLLRSMFFEQFVKPDFLHLDQETFGDEWLKSLAKRHQIAAWTVDNRKRGDELLKLGVKSLIVDHLSPKDFK